MTSSARIDDLQRKYQENPRRYFAPLANELRRAGEAGRAVSVCETGLRADPDHLSGHVVLGQSLADMGDRAGAERAFRRAVELDPENVVALRSLGDLARDRGDLALARDWYQRALETDPRDPELATRMSTLAATPATTGEPAHLEGEAGPAREDDGIATAAGFAGGADAVATGLPDEAQMREFQAEREAQEFTAGFFAALLDAQSAEAEGPRDAGVAPTAEAVPADDEPTPVADAGGQRREELPESPAAPVDAVDESPVTSPPSEAAEHGRAAPEGAVRPPEVTVAEDALDVRPDEREYLDDLMELDGELASDLYADEAALVEEAEASAGLVAARGAGAEDAVDAFDRLAEVVSGAGDEGSVATEVGPTDDEAVPAPVAAAAADAPAAPEPAASPAAGSPVVEPTDHAMPAEEEEAPQLSFVTATMGTLLLQQGFRSDALQIFRQLSARSPDDADLRARVADLEAELAPGGASGGITVSGWLRALAAARPDASDVPPVPPASDRLETEDSVRAVDRETAGSADRVEEIPEPEPAADLAAGDVAAADVIVEADRDEPAGEPTGEPATSGGAGWVEAIPEDSVVAAADSAFDSIAGSATESTAESATESAMDAATESTVESRDDVAPLGTDLLAGAAAAAASAVTWEAVEPEAASDELFFGDDPLDWGQVRAVEPEAEMVREAGPQAVSGTEAAPSADLSLEELLGRPVSADDELAAGALASATMAMQGDAVVDAALAEASAEDPMALENVLTPTPTSLAALRGGASFSFEQFFRPAEAAVDEGGASDAGSGASPATSPELTAGSGAGSGAEGVRSTDDDAAAAREADLAEFHAWLAGLSKS